MAKQQKRGRPGADAAPFPELPDYKDHDALAGFLQTVLRKVNRPVRMDELLRVTHLPRKAKKHIETALYALLGEGRAIRSSGGWSAPARVRHAEGVLSVAATGVGFVSTGHGEADIYIHPAAMHDAWHGDTVEVVILPGRKGPSKEGRITRVLRHSHAELPAHALKPRENGLWMCAPTNPRIQALFLTDVSALEKAMHPGDLLLLRPGEKAGPNIWEAVASVNLEHEESPAAQERITKSNHGIPGLFPETVLEAVGQLPADPGPADFAGRRDLRELAFVTIDGRTAKDFDDAIHVEADAGGFRLRVAIADVSHYVRPDTPLDREARQRGNSCYFPLSVEPMLPEPLSNGLCSLKPDVPRLAMVADMRFSPSGVRSGASFYPAVITSRARLTYGQILRGLLRHEAEDEQALAPVLPMLGEAERLARALLERRRERGGLAFDLPEAAYVFSGRESSVLSKPSVSDAGSAHTRQGLRTEPVSATPGTRREPAGPGPGTGEPEAPESPVTDAGSGQVEVVGVIARERHFGHQLIEEFMIAANETVAEFLAGREEPTLYRVHQPPDPDKLTALAEFLDKSGLDAGGGVPSGRKAGGGRPGASRGAAPRKARVSVRDLGRVLEENRGTPREYVVTRLVLRSMMQARYQPENEGHFGLASDCYCHFTSPIRRYADLVVHRSLKHALGTAGGDGGKAYSEARLEAVGDHINATERAAVEAEREIHKRLGVLFLRGREGEEFNGVISGVTDFGIFVELPDMLIEGMIRLGGLDDDYYEYVEDRQELRGKRTGRAFRLGQPLRVRLADVSLGRLEVNFTLPEAAGRAAAETGDAPGRRLRDGIRLAGGPRKAGKAPAREASTRGRGRGGSGAGARPARGQRGRGKKR